jgi:hypothetical protein
MISKERLQEAEDKFPLPKLAKWYLLHFPKGEFNLVMMLLFILGFSMTVIGLPKKIIAIPTFLFVGLLIPVSGIHVTC